MQTRLLALFFIVFLCPVVAPAQQGTAEIGGKVVDAQGAVLPGVNIVLTNEDTGAVREITSTADGSYFASQMVPGRYRINAKLEGFRVLDRLGVTLTVGQTTTLDLSMEVGALAETLTVTGEAPVIDLSSAEIGGHISASEITELPAFSRSYMAFVGNVPGAVFVPTEGFLNDTMLANGQSAQANAVSMDGATNIDDLRGSNVGGQARVPNEGLQEVQVITNQFDAEYGRASGAVINAVTKSGTNQFSGAAFAFFTGKGVIARDFFTRVNDLPEPETAKDEWGGTIGGPILRNKLFFFGTLERTVMARNMARTFPTRPEYSFSEVSDEAAWNTMWRIDHQASRANTWAFRWLRELAPQYDRPQVGNNSLSGLSDETDLDQNLVGTLTTVVSNSMVNTVRLGATIEETVHANRGLRAQDPANASCVPCPDSMLLGQSLLAPRLEYQSVNVNSAVSDFSLDDAYSIEDTFSWFVPNKMGRHDAKFGAKYTYIWISNPNNGNANGTYRFGHDLAFDTSNPRSYPERLSIRVPGPLEYEMITRTYELYAQDKWQIRPNLTLSLGVRYDLEVTPIYERDNPLFLDASRYPVDKNNVAPRLGFVWNPDGEAKSVVRGGYGMFFDRTLLGTIDDILFATKYSQSFTADFPQGNVDPGPSNGRYPTEPVLNTPSIETVNRSIIDATYPPGTTRRNTGTVEWDDPERNQPYFHQVSAGYERQLFAGLSASADYVRMRGNDLFLSPNLNIPHKLNTSRTGPVVFLDPFGVLNPSLAPGEAPYAGPVRLRTTKYGYSNYDALNLSMERRYLNNWSIRGGYALGYSRGVVRNQADTPEFQVGTDMNLDKYYAPANVDRRHTATISGRMVIPRTGGVSLSGNLRMMSGESFTIHDTTFDLDQNNIGLDPLPPGTYNPSPAAGPHVMTDVKSEGGRNGARGPGFMQLDLRFTYRLRLGGRRTFDVFGEVFNVTNRANFVNPSGDLRNTTDFLRLQSLVAVTGLPRQGQLGLRFGF
jgi:Carboxypeptidase regulatory-like domain/TonB dependent receptor-like, beta-barrel